ncbi:MULTISPECIES: MFS transporter [unclassified Streptomyces]|uniref:MFS transporter n=1 Tax=unclassified Streptomyces TaxID=2593676 RepID=UPI002E1940BD|nr:MULTISPECIES: MFS transporter [unclassified Streptomyces]
MTNLSAHASGAAEPDHRSQRPRAVLPALCATQVTSWGIVYYAFPVLNSRITADTGWSTASTTGAFSVALLVSAAVGIPVGRVLDRRGPHKVMTFGSVLAVAAVLAVATAPNLPVFYAAWFLAGTAMAATFYQPAFAAVTRWWGPQRVRALTVVTLAGGLASTVFAPITAALADHFSWRTTYAILAASLALITIPAHALALRAPWPAEPEAPSHAEGVSRSDAVARTRPFLLLAAAFTLSGFAVYAVVIGLVPLLTERGADATTAAWALGLGGAGQTLGRTLYASLARRTSAATRTVLLIAAGGATTLALGLVPGPIPLLVALAIAAGMVRGNLTLLQATAVTDRWGSAHYGTLSGLLTAPATVAAAIAPWAGAGLAESLGGYPHLFTTLSIASLAAAFLALGSAITRSDNAETSLSPACHSQPSRDTSGPPPSR